MVLDPIVPLTSREVAALVGAVRTGAGLLVAGGRSAIHDSLGLRVSPAAMERLYPTDREAWDSLGVGYSTLWPRATLRQTDSAPPDIVSFLRATRSPLRSAPVEDVLLGIPFGRGRIVVISDGAPLANRSLRTDLVSLLGIRMLEWRAPGGRPSIVFGEYHQGHGHQQQGHHVQIGGIPALVLLNVRGLDMPWFAAWPDTRL